MRSRGNDREKIIKIYSVKSTSRHKKSTKYSIESEWMENSSEKTESRLIAQYGTRVNVLGRDQGRGVDSSEEDFRQYRFFLHYKSRDLEKEYLEFSMGKRISLWHFVMLIIGAMAHLPHVITNIPSWPGIVSRSLNSLCLLLYLVDSVCCVLPCLFRYHIWKNFVEILTCVCILLSCTGNVFLTYWHVGTKFYGFFFPFVLTFNVTVVPSVSSIRLRFFVLFICILCCVTLSSVIIIVLSIVFQISSTIFISIGSIILFSGYSGVIAFTNDQSVRTMFVHKKLLDKEKKKLIFERRRAEKILYNILPSRFISDVSPEFNLLSYQFRDMVVLQTDLCNFTEFCVNADAESIIRTLNSIYEKYDSFCVDLGICKFCSLGDGYLAISFGDSDLEEEVLRVVEFGRRCLILRNEYSRTNALKWNYNLRVGVSIGGIRCFVYGKFGKHVSFDIYGNHLKIVDELEQSAPTNSINVGKRVFALTKTKFTYEKLEQKFIIKVSAEDEKKEYVQNVKETNPKPPKVLATEGSEVVDQHLRKMNKRENFLKKYVRTDYGFVKPLLLYYPLSKEIKFMKDSFYSKSFSVKLLTATFLHLFQMALFIVYFVWFHKSFIFTKSFFYYCIGSIVYDFLASLFISLYLIFSNRKKRNNSKIFPFGANVLLGVGILSLSICIGGTFCEILLDYTRVDYSLHIMMMLSCAYFFVSFSFLNIVFICAFVVVMVVVEIVYLRIHSYVFVGDILIEEFTVLVSIFSIVVILMIVLHFNEKNKYDTVNQVKETNMETTEEITKNESLIQSFIPKFCLERLYEQEGASNLIFDRISDVLIVFIKLKPLKTEELNNEKLEEVISLFSNFTEKIMVQYDCTKIKSFYYMYMYICQRKKSEKTCEQVQRALFSTKECRKVCVDLLSEQISFHCGVAYGDVSGGIIGSDKLLYDIVGSNVNICARLCGSSEDNQIQIDEKVFSLANEQKLHSQGDEISFQHRGEVFLKGSGKHKCYYVH